MLQYKGLQFFWYLTQHTIWLDWEKMRAMHLKSNSQFSLLGDCVEWGRNGKADGEFQIFLYTHHIYYLAVAELRKEDGSVPTPVRGMKQSIVWCPLREKSNQNNGAEPLTRHEILRAFKKLSNKDIKTVFAIKNYTILVALFAFGLFECIILKFKGRRRKEEEISPEWVWIAASVQECRTCHSSNKRNCIKHYLQRTSQDLAQYTAPPCLMHSTIGGIQGYMHFDKHNEMEFIALYANWWSLENCIAGFGELSRNSIPPPFFSFLLPSFSSELKNSNWNIT